MNLMPKFEITKKNYLNLLIFLFPLSFIAGNMIVNINIILIIFFSIILFRKDLFRINYYLLDKLLFSFFFLILLTGIINDFYFYSIKLAWKGYFATILKSFFFLKYLLLYIILRYLIEKDLINLKYFFLSCFVGTIFVSFDIIYQFFNGDDIFGFKGTPGKLAGPFGDELIAGG